jgi:hypothetical protein
MKALHDTNEHRSSAGLANGQPSQVMDKAPFHLRLCQIAVPWRREHVAKPTILAYLNDRLRGCGLNRCR